MTPFDKLKKIVRGKDGVAKILIVRSARMDLFRNALACIKAELPGAEVHVLLQKSSKEEILEEKGIAGVITIPDGLFRIKDISHPLLDDIRNQKFDLIVLLLNNESGRGYIPLRLLLSLSKIPNKWEFNVACHFKKSGLMLYLLSWEYLLGLLKKSIGVLFYKMLASYWGRRLKLSIEKDGR